MGVEPVRFGIVGLGMGASRAKTAAQTPGAEVTCVCDILADRARAVSAELGCDFCTHYAELLARADVECVGVFTPSGMHAEFGIQAARAGKHVFTTKPMDVRVESCDRLIAAAREAGVVLAVDFGLRYDETTRKIKMALDAGRLGQPLAADVRLKWLREQSYFEGGSPPGWRKQRQFEGGSMANQGVHYVDLIIWLLGPVKTVYAKAGTLCHDIETEDLVLALVEFESGAWGMIQTTTCAYPHIGTAVEIVGKRGVIGMGDDQLAFYATRDTEEASLDEFSPSLQRPRSIFEDMIGAIRHGRPVAVNGEEGKRSVQVFCAAYESAATGKTVAIC